MGIHIAPVYFQLVAECPEVLAAVPALSRLLCGKRPGRGRGCKWARCQGRLWRRQQRNQHYHQRQQQEQQQQQRQQQTKSGTQFQEASVPEVVSNLTDLISNASQKIFGHDVEMQKAIAASLYKEAQTFADNVGKTIESTINATAEAGKAAVAAASMPAGESSPKPVDKDGGQSRQQQPQQKEQPQKIESKQLRAKYVKDPDSKALVVVPNEVFKHTWKIKNTGESAWPQGVVLKSVGGDDIKGSGTRVTLLELGPGETIDVPLTFTAPSQEGRFISYWRLSHNDKKFGDRMWVDMTVKSTSSRRLILGLLKIRMGMGWKRQGEMSMKGSLSPRRKRSPRFRNSLLRLHLRTMKANSAESWLLWRRWDLATMRMCSMLLKLRMGISERQ